MEIGEIHLIFMKIKIILIVKVLFTYNGLNHINYMRF